MQEDLKARPGQPLPSVGHAQALRPLLQHLRILAELANHAVASRRSQAQGGPLAESSERHLGLVPRCEQLGPHASQVFAPEVATTDLPGPGLPLREFGSARVLALMTVAMPLRFVAPHHGPGAFVEESVSVPGGVGYGPGEPLLSLRLPELRRQPSAAAPGLPAAEMGRRAPLRGHRRVPLPEERAGQRSLPHPCLLSPRLHRARPGGRACGSHLRGLALRRPQRASGPAALRRQGLVCAEMLDSGLAQWRHVRWSLEATAHVDQRWLEQALQAMEEAWPEGEEHMAKLSINALVGLFARNLDLVHSMRTSNHQVDGEGCSWRQTFTDAAGRMHWDHVFVAELLSNSSYRPVHDFIMGAEYTAMARVRRALAEVPKRYLKCLKTDCLVMQDVPKKHRSAIERLLRLSHRDGTPVYRCEPTEGLRGQYREPRMQAEPIREKPAWRRVEDPLTHCLGGESLLLTGYPGTGKTHLARKIVEALRELGDTVHIITKTHAAVQNVGLRAQTADHWVRRNVRSGRCSATWLVIEELTQLDTPLWADIACLSMNTSMRFLLLGDFRQLPAVLDSFAGAEVCRELKDSQLLHDLAGGWCHELSERWRFDEGVFSFLQWLRVDEAEQVPLREAVQMARQRFPRRGEPEVCLVISHAKRLQINERENRRRAPEDALLVQYAGPETAGTNAPQTMRVWPGLRLVGAGGKVQRGVFVTVSEVGERVTLESGQSFEPRELLKHTRLCSAITYASVQGLTLRGRVWLCDVESPHFTMKHLYMGCSRATSSELLSVL